MLDESGFHAGFYQNFFAKEETDNSSIRDITVEEQKIEAAQSLYELYFIRCKVAYGTFQTEANEILTENGYDNCIME